MKWAWTERHRLPEVLNPGKKLCLLFILAQLANFCLLNKYQEVYSYSEPNTDQQRASEGKQWRPFIVDYATSNKCRLKPHFVLYMTTKDSTTTSPLSNKHNILRLYIYLHEIHFQISYRCGRVIIQ